jgi:hypothetical protein
MTAFNLRLCTTATNTDTMNANEGGSVTYSYGGEGGILTLAYSLCYHVSTNLHEIRINIGDSPISPPSTFSTVPHK